MPLRTLRHFSWMDFFDTKITSDGLQTRPIALKEEFKIGRVIISVRAGGRNVPVKPKKIKVIDPHPFFKPPVRRVYR